MGFRFLIVLCMGMFSASALAIPLRTPNEVLPQATAEELFLLRNDQSQTDYDFEGIVKLSNCSGSLIKFENAPASDKALILSNGHCIGGFTFLAPGEVIYNQESSRNFQIYKTLGETARVQAEMLVYATMTGTDISIYRLKKTYEEIENEFGIHPLTLSSSHPEIGQDMEVVSGYWERGYSCKIEAFVFEMREDDWTFKDSIRYSRPGCETIGGTSGSPIVLKGERRVIGINNTGNESGERCTMNNPCEVDEKGNIFFKKDILTASKRIKFTAA